MAVTALAKIGRGCNTILKEDTLSQNLCFTHENLQATMCYYEHTYQIIGFSMNLLASSALVLLSLQNQLKTFAVFLPLSACS